MHEVRIIFRTGCWYTEWEGGKKKDYVIIIFGICMMIDQFKFSIMIDVAPPPPLQIQAIPNLPWFYLRTVKRDKMILAPLTPMGWPKATAPPLTLTFSRGMSSNFMLAKTVAAKASLISWKSMLDILSLRLG